jgi:hypothetical protein
MLGPGGLDMGKRKPQVAATCKEEGKIYLNSAPIEPIVAGRVAEAIFWMRTAAANFEKAAELIRQATGVPPREGRSW